MKDKRVVDDLTSQVRDSRQTVQHRKKTFGQTSGCVHREVTKKKYQRISVVNSSVGWFVNVQEFN